MYMNLLIFRKTEEYLEVRQTLWRESKTNDSRLFNKRFLFKHTLFLLKTFVVHLSTPLKYKHNLLGTFENGATLEYCGGRFCPSERDVIITGKASPSTTNTLIWIYCSFGCASVLFSLVFLSPLKKSDQLNKKPIKGHLISVFRLIPNKNNLLLFPITIFCGIVFPFFQGDFTKVNHFYWIFIVSSV